MKIIIMIYKQDLKFIVIAELERENIDDDFKLFVEILQLDL